MKFRSIVLLIIISLTIVSCDNETSNEVMDESQLNEVIIKSNEDETSTNEEVINLEETLKIEKPSHSIQNSYDRWTVLNFDDLIFSEYNLQVAVNGKNINDNKLELVDESSYLVEFYAYDGKLQSERTTLKILVKPVELTPDSSIPMPKLNIEEKYHMDDLFDPEQIIESAYPVITSFDHKEIDNKVFSLSEGYHTIECYAYFDGKRSLTISERIYVVKDYKDLVANFKFTQEKYYRVGQEIYLGLMTSQYVNRKLNGEEIIDYFSILPIGDYTLEAYAYNDYTRSETKNFDFKVVAKENTNYIDVYTYIDDDYTQMITLPKEDVIDRNVIRQLFYVTSESTTLYDCVLLDDNRKVYYQNELQERIDVPCDTIFGTGTFITPYVDGMIDASFRELDIESYYIHEEIQTWENERCVAIAHPASGLVHVLMETPHHLEFNPSGDKLFIEAGYWRGMPREIQTRIFSFNDDGLETIYTNNKLGYGHEDIIWISDHEITYKENMCQANQLYHTDFREIKLNSRLTIKDDEVEYTTDMTPYLEVMAEDDGLNDHKITLYNAISNKPVKEKEIEYSSIQTSYFSDTYGIIDSEIVLWFEITTENGESGFTYRTKHWDERASAYDGYLVLSDDSLKKISDYDEFYGGLLVHHFGIEEELYAVEYFNIESYIYTYDLDKGEENYYNQYDINQQHDLITNYDDENNTLQIKSFDNKNEMLLYEMPLNDYEFLSVRWSDNDVFIYLFDPNVNGKFEICLKYDKGTWSANTVEQGDAYEFEIKRNVDVLNMRKKPSLESDILGKAKRSDVYIVIGLGRDEDYNTWYQLDNGLWVASQYCVLNK